MREILRVIAALFAATFVPALCVALLITQYPQAGQTGDISKVIELFPKAFAFAVAGGLPLYFLLKRFRMLAWGAFYTWGFLVGCVPYALGTLSLDQQHDQKTLLLYGCFGILGGLASWMVWRAIPDKS